MLTEENHPELLPLTAQIVGAYVEKNPLPASELPGLIADVSGSLSSLSKQPEPPSVKPAVPVNKSVKPDEIVCLEDGKRFKSLKRHLMTEHGLSPEEYREKWNLPKGYPMVAPNYAATRSELAKSMGLGRKRTRRR